MKEPSKPSTVEKHPDVIAWEKFKDKCKDYFRVDTITHQRYLENRIEDAFYHGISHGESKPSTVIDVTPLQSRIKELEATNLALIARMQELEE